MRELVSTRNLILELSERMNLDLKGAFVISKSWEENIGTQNLANSKGYLMTTHTQHIDIKYHFFRSKIKPNEIEVLRIQTDHQRAGIFIKGLTILPFEVRWKLGMGW